MRSRDRNGAGHAGLACAYFPFGVRSLLDIGITAACRRYLLPLIGGEGYPPYRNGLPAYVTLKGASVPKRLRTPFVI